ncbi:MAG: 6,7-dimethyl-8-ribityllumazine synthase [Cytophagales bacterium]
MATALQNLSSQALHSKQNFSKYKIGIAAAEWNTEITSALLSGAVERLVKEGVYKRNIFEIPVPGSFELVLGAQFLAEKSEIDAVIVLGCVIQGETPHFDYICQAVAKGITDVNLKFNKPIVFGVLTTLNQQQAIDRAGGIHGNKGDEAAVTALKMISAKKSVDKIK